MIIIFHSHFIDFINMEMRQRDVGICACENDVEESGTRIARLVLAA